MPSEPEEEREGCGRTGAGSNLVARGTSRKKRVREFLSDRESTFSFQQRASLVMCIIDETRIS